MCALSWRSTFWSWKWRFWGTAAKGVGGVDFGVIFYIAMCLHAVGIVDTLSRLVMQAIVGTLVMAGKSE
jgi:hypothetical protein